MGWRALVLLGGVLGPSLTAPGMAWADEPPTVRTEQLLRTLAASPQERPSLDGYFDREALVGAVVAPFKAQFTPPQFVRAREVFWQLVQTLAYPGTLRGAQWEVRPAVAKGSDAEVTVHARKPQDDWESDLTFTWRKSVGPWRVVDVAFDGASLVVDYRNQFARLLAKEGAAGLLRKLELRQAEEQRKRGAASP